METGRLKIITDAMAREVTVDQGGLADGVIYIDKKTSSDNRVAREIVVLAASACESARILLNSKSSKFPQGLANSSGVVGKYLTDSTGLGVTGFIPKLMDGIAAQRGRHRRHAPVHAVVARQQEARFPARLPHRDRRRTAHADGRIRRWHPPVHRHRRRRAADGVRRLRQAAEERLPPALWRDGQFRRPRRNDPEQGQLLRDRSDGGRQVGHPGAALPLQVERLRDQPGEAHAGDLPRDHRADGRHADRRDAVARRRASASRLAGGSSTNWA